jgi:microcystin-dependent protein
MDPFLGMITIFGFNFAPRGWAFCAGQILSIQQNTALFALLGTTYGGNGQTTFGLPDLRSRVAIGMGQGPGFSNYVIGQTGGTENVTLLSQQMPAHTHTMMGSADAQTVGNVSGSSLGSAARGASSGTIYAPGTTNQVPMGSATTPAGGNQPHPNMQPYLTVNYCIALEGIFPSRN